MSEHPNVELLRKIYARDRDALKSGMSPDFVCHTPGRSQISGNYKGTDFLTVRIAKVAELTGGTFRARSLGPMLVNDEWGMVPVQVSAERDGKKMDMPAFGIWRFKDGQVLEHWEMNYDQAAFDEFFK